MPIDVLAPTRYLNYVGQPDARGWNPTTHLAQVKFSDGRAYDAFVRFDPPNKPFLANEVVGFLLGEHLGLKQPSKAALLLMEASNVRQLLGDRTPSWMATTGMAIGWCTTALDGKSLSQVYCALAERDQAILTWLGTEDGGRTLAFDELMGIRDRIASNMIFLKRNGIAVIDNADLLFGQDWRSSRPDVPADEHCDLLDFVKRQECLGHVPQQTYMKALSHASASAKKHAKALGAAHPYISDLVAKLPGSPDPDVVLCLLAERSFYNWMNTRLGLLPL